MTGDVVVDLTSIVVVAADSGPLLRACIASALASSAAVEVILVDNASTDGELERVLQAHSGDDRLRILRNTTNLGFGAGCNRGAQLARGDVLVFLNPDTALSAHSVAELRAVLSNDTKIGVLGVNVCDADGRPARGNRRRDPTLGRALASMSGLSRWQQRWPVLGGVEMPPDPAIPEVETVDAISGACMALPRAAFVQVQGFDEGYFLHCEDLDLCRRIRDTGLRVAIATCISVVHAQGSSSRHRPLFVARHKHRGLWRYFNKFDPAARNPLLRAMVWCGIQAHFTLAAGLIATRALFRRAN